MGITNHEPYEVNKFIEAPSISSNINQQTGQDRSTRTVGLRPTDGPQDAYKRSANSRASKRSHAERRSYLMATGHLDREEKIPLSSQISLDQLYNQQYVSHSPYKNNTSSQSLANQTSPQQYHQQQFGAGDHELLNYAEQFNPLVTNQNNIRNKSLLSSSLSMHNNKNSKSPKSNNKNYNQNNGRSTNRNNIHSSTGNFERSYTEVALPMKTSPAFEYLLHDDKRRSKRCYLRLTYIILVTTCLLIIIFYSYKLVKRLNHN